MGLNPYLNLQPQQQIPQICGVLQLMLFIPVAEPISFLGTISAIPGTDPLLPHPGHHQGAAASPSILSYQGVELMTLLLDLTHTFWHVPVHQRFCQFLAL